jgi:magnesium transporter
LKERRVKGVETSEHQTVALPMDAIKLAIQKGNKAAMRQLLEELQPYDLGQIFFRLNGVYRRQLLDFLSPEKIAELVEEVEKTEQLEILSALPPEKLSRVLNRVPSDEMADLLEGLEEQKVQTLLKKMEQAEADKVRALLDYPGDTAGGKMTTEYISVYDHYTVEEAIQYLRQEAPTAETVYYIYVIDGDDRLVGVVSLRELLIAQPDVPVREIMYERVISVPADMDQEEVAAILGRYDFLAIPVVDDENRLLGIITVDDILDVLIEEAQEDIAKLSAVSRAEKEVLASPLASARRRIPWLMLLLFIGVLTSKLVGFFEDTISRLTALAFFMPMVAGMTGNTGTQSLAMVIRGIASGELTRDKYGRFILQQASVGLIIGAVCSLLIVGVLYGMENDLRLGIVVGFSLLLTLLIGTIAGTVIPLLLHFLKVDPAVASGPLITTLSDVFSLVVYFGIATLCLNFLL